MTEREDPKLKGGTNKKHQIICKYWIRKSCMKDDKCEYLHQQPDSIHQPFTYQNTIVKECPMYNLGFCKNGPLCKFKHEKKIEGNYELPIWYLEYIFEKPINNIFEDYEQSNTEDIENLKLKVYGMLDDNNKKRFLRFNCHFKSHDNYALKKNSIIENLSKKVRYFFIRSRNMDIIKYAMDTNVLLVSRNNLIKVKEAKKSCDDVIFITFDNSSKNFYGYCKYKFNIEDGDYDLSSLIDDVRDFNNGNNSFIRVEWLWKTKLSESKVELLKNPLNNNENVIDSIDGQEISIDVGYYLCRLMIKRLTKEEVHDYLNMREDDKPYNSTKIININNININNDKKNINEIGEDIGSFIYDELNNNIMNKSIIVTNISNLQVNISQNSYCDEKITIEKKRNKRKRSKSKKKKRRKEESYDSDETVILKEDKYLDKKRERSGSKNIDLKNEIKENKIYKNKLFSNAMEKLASSYLKVKKLQKDK